MATNRNWFKRLFRLDFDDQFDAALDLIEVQEIAIVDVHDRVDGVQEAVKVVTGRVDTVEGKLAALKTFDFFGRTVVAQFDYEKSIVGDTSITVSIDNVAAQAFLRFGSARVVDTIDAVWFISKTGVPIQNDFGDVLHPAAQRRDVQDFLYMTSEKQGDEPLDIIIPEHTHDNYISIEELEEVKDALDLKFDKAGGDLASGGAFIGTNRLKPQGAGANTLYEGTSYSHPQSLINSGMMKEYAAEKDHDHDYAAADHEHDSIEFPDQQPPVHVGETPPDDPSEGDLWMLDSPDDETVTDRLFVYVDDSWEPTTSLQRERQHRIAEDLLVATKLSEADSHYMMRLDPFVLPAATMTGKEEVVHHRDLPEEVTDDKIHFKQDVNTGNYFGEPGELAYRGPNPGDDIKYLIIHHHKNATVSYREEWLVKDVRDANGTIHVRATRAYGDSYASYTGWTCDVWLLTEDEAAAEKDHEHPHDHDDDYLPLTGGTLTGDLDFAGEDNRITENGNNRMKFAGNVVINRGDNTNATGFQVKGKTADGNNADLLAVYHNASGYDAINYKGKQESNENIVTVKHVRDKIANHNHDAQYAGIDHGHDDLDSRVTALEEKPDPEGYDDTELREQVEANTEAISNLSSELPTTPDGEPVIRTVTVPGLNKNAFYEDMTFYPKNSSGLMADPYVCTKLYISTERDDPYKLDGLGGSTVAVAIGRLLMIREDNGRAVMSWTIGQIRSEGQGRLEITVGEPLTGDGSWGPGLYTLVLKDV